MSNISQNIHPCSTWSSIKAYLYGINRGSCVSLEFIDEEGNKIYITIHYGFEEEKDNFVEQLKKVISSLKEVE